MTRKNEASDITSQHIRNNNPFRAVTTSSMAAAKMLKKNQMAPMIHPPMRSFEILHSINGRDGHDHGNRQYKNRRERIESECNFAERHLARE